MDSNSTLQLDFKVPISEPVRRQPLAWRGFRIEQVVLETDEGYDFSAVGDISYLALHEMTLLDGELSIDGLPNVTKTELRNTLTFAPQGASIAGWAKPAPGRNSYTALCPSSEHLAQLAA